jgi:hypothetical protein
MFYTSKTIGVRYTSLCFLITWLANNTAAHTRRVTVVAIGFMSTNAGGIVSTWLYPKSSAPNYKFAAKFNLALLFHACGDGIEYLVANEEKSGEG